MVQGTSLAFWEATSLALDAGFEKLPQGMAVPMAAAKATISKISWWALLHDIPNKIEGLLVYQQNHLGNLDLNFF